MDYLKSSNMNHKVEALIYFKELVSSANDTLETKLP